MCLWFVLLLLLIHERVLLVQAIIFLIFWFGEGGEEGRMGKRFNVSVWWPESITVECFGIFPYSAERILFLRYNIKNTSFAVKCTSYQ